MYNGHKHCHGIKFQSIVIPDGLFASMHGPVNGNRHDSFLLSISELLDKLQTLCQIYLVVISSPCMVIQHTLNQSTSLEDTRAL